MQKDNVTYCRDRLEGMSTAQLDNLLQEELHGTPLDGEKVRLILSILQTRENADEYGPEIEREWEKYQKRSEKTKVTPVKKHGWLLRVASIVLLICMFSLVIPQEAKAEGLFDRVACWTDSFFKLLGFGDDEITEEYVFRSDNPGLQQVYDAVVDLGVTEPVVPMWLPDGFELTQCEMDDVDKETTLTVIFKNQDKTATLVMINHAKSDPSTYHKDTYNGTIFEYNGDVYNIMSNDGTWSAVWEKDNVECVIYVDCQENALYRILKSIYSMEDD